jgi:monoamine oxidase
LVAVFRLRKKQNILECGLGHHQQRLRNLEPRERKKNVIVVGGGYAGLYAGYLLVQLGYRVTVFEATDRVGGRVHSLLNFSRGRVIEAGAELIGLNHSALLSLVREFGLGLTDLPTPDQDVALNLQPNIVLDGLPVGPEEAKQLEEEMNAVLMRISEEANKITYPSQPWFEPPDIQALDQISLGDVFDDWGIQGRLRQLLDLTFENNNAAPVDKQSWLGILCLVKGGSIGGDTKDYWDVVELFRCANGNQAVAECMAERIQSSKRGRVYLSSPVKKIRWRSRSRSFNVSTAKETFTADYVILATAPSVWNRIEFRPRVNLQPYRPALGPAIKYLSTVCDRFWIPLQLQPAGTSSTIGETWEATDNQTVKGRQGINLTVFAGGRQAQQALDLTTQENFVRFQAGLDGIFRNQFTKNLIREKLSFHPRLPFVQTGYSYMGLGLTTTTAKLDNQPFAPYGGQLFFAGEYVSTAFYGYMEGALQSALHAVELLMLKENIPLPAK